MSLHHTIQTHATLFWKFLIKLLKKYQIQYVRLNFEQIKNSRSTNLLFPEISNASHHLHHSSASNVKGFKFNLKPASNFLYFCPTLGASSWVSTTWVKVLIQQSKNTQRKSCIHILTIAEVLLLTSSTHNAGKCPLWVYDFIVFMDALMCMWYFNVVTSAVLSY